MGLKYLFVGKVKDLKDYLNEEMEAEFDLEIERGFAENMTCDTYGYCAGIKCRRYAECGGV